MIKKIFLGLLALVLLFVVIQIVNAAKYEMTVNVVEGENILGLNPTTERLDFGDLSRNNGIARQVSMANGGSIDIFVMAFKFGELASLADLDRNFFVLSPGEEVQMSFDVTIPPSAEIRKYNGRVWVFRIPKPF
jgi:hypothetical protein